MMKKMTRPATAYARDEAGPGLGDALARPEEETGADGAADGDHLDLPAAEAPLVPLFGGVLLVDLHRGHVWCAFLHTDPGLSSASDRVTIPPDCWS
jgi:hypothetical protein